MTEQQTSSAETGLPNPAESYVPQLDGIRGLAIALVLDKIVTWQGFWHWLAYYLLVTVGLVGIGALSWRFFEHPIIAWNKRRERRQAPVAAP